MLRWHAAAVKQVGCAPISRQHDLAQRRRAVPLQPHCWYPFASTLVRVRTRERARKWLPEAEVAETQHAILWLSFAVMSRTKIPLEAETAGDTTATSTVIFTTSESTRQLAACVRSTGQV